MIINRVYQTLCIWLCSARAAWASRHDLSRLAIFLKFSPFFRGVVRGWKTVVVVYRIGSSGRVARGEPPVDPTFGRDAEAKGNKLHSGVQRLRLLASPSRGLVGLSLSSCVPPTFPLPLHPSSRFIRAPSVTFTQPRIIPHSTFTSNLPL